MKLPSDAKGGDDGSYSGGGRNHRIRWPISIGIAGRFAAEYAQRT